MERIPQAPPHIGALATQADRPLWSVMIPTYNCTEFLKEALSSVLAQDLGVNQMQIEVVDDASTDADVAALVQELGQGRVSYFRQGVNVGSLRNFETCLNRSRGQLVHLLHGDDRVLPGFYAKLTELFERFPQTGAAFCNHYHVNERGQQRVSQLREMDQDGILVDWLEKIAQYQRLQYVSMVVRRGVYEQLGGFYGVTYGEDWEMWVRIARHYPVAYTPQILAEYRVHPTSISSAKTLTGQAFRDLHFVMGEIQHHLSDDKKKEIYRKSKKYYTQFEVYGAFNTWKNTGNFSNLILNIIKILKIYSSSGLYIKIVKLFLKGSLQRLLMAQRVKQKMSDSTTDSPKWDWEITNKTSWWQVGLLDVLAYRNLLARLVRRDFLVSYQQTLLGPFWTLIQPALTVLTYVLVFNKLVGISTGSVPPTLFYLTGTILWNLFNDVFMNTSTTFTANAELFNKVYFPRLVMPLAAVSAQFMRMLIQLGLLILVIIYYWLSKSFLIQINAWIIAVPIILVGITSIGLALGLLFSIITAKYRDLMNVVMLIMRMLMFITPVIYPTAIISEKVRWIVVLNPLTPMFELFRYALLGEGSFTIPQLLYSLGSTLLLLLAGILLFNKQKEALIDIL